MDPNVTLAKIRERITDLTNVIEENEWPTSVVGHGATDLMQMVDDLDGWLSKGGFLPTDWSKNR